MKLTHNFSSEEFTCKCSTCKHFQTGTINYSFVKTLQKIRDQYGTMFVTSGYRCKDHNAKIGGAEHSYHLRGMAADIRVGSWKHRIRLIQMALKFGLTVGIGKEYIHLDSRSDQIMFHY